MFPYIWTAVIVVALMLEGMTCALVSIWFIPGALTALIMSLFPIHYVWQLVAFVAISLVMLFCGKFIFRPVFKKTKTNVDALIGKTVLITEAVDNIAGKGAGKLGAQEWSVRAAPDSQPLLPEDRAEIVAIEGVKLICRKIATQEINQ